MKIPLIAFCVAVSAFCAAAQNITRVTTLVVHSARTNSAGAVLSHGNATNQIYLAAGEAARLSTFGHVTHGFDEANFA